MPSTIYRGGQTHEKIRRARVALSRAAYEDTRREAEIFKLTHGNHERWWAAPHNTKTCAACALAYSLTGQMPFARVVLHE